MPTSYNIDPSLPDYDKKLIQKTISVFSNFNFEGFQSRLPHTSKKIIIDGYVFGESTKSIIYHLIPMRDFYYQVILMPKIKSQYVYIIDFYNEDISGITTDIKKQLFHSKI